jgi:uncharacterized membrane protein
VLFAIFCAPVIYQVFTHQRLAAVGTARHYPITIAFIVIGLAIRHHVLSHQRLAAVGTARSHLVEITLVVIGRTLTFLETRIGDRSATTSTDKMLWMPHGPKGIEIVSEDGLSTCFTDKLRRSANTHCEYYFITSMITVL